VKFSERGIAGVYSKDRKSLLEHLIASVMTSDIIVIVYYEE